MPKRRELSRLVRNWLLTNRNGRLASDQWLNLVTEPLATLILLSIPVVLLFAFTPLDDMLLMMRYTRVILPLFPVVIVFVLLARARYFATSVVQYQVLYAGHEEPGPFWRFARQLTMFTEQGEPVPFDHFISAPPHLEPDMPYMIYYLEQKERRTLLSFAPLEHPNAESWQPTEQFYRRQRRRRA